MKLTDEHRKMVEDNHNLIYWYINMNDLNINDYYDLLAIELCKAVLNYDESKGSLANYFKIRADGIMYTEYRKSKAKKRFHNETEYLDNIKYISDGNDYTEEIEIKDWIEKCDSEVLNLKLQGYSQSEIADKLNVSQSYVSRILNRLKRCYYEYNK